MYFNVMLGQIETGRSGLQPDIFYLKAYFLSLSVARGPKVWKQRSLTNKNKFIWKLCWLEIMKHFLLWMYILSPNPPHVAAAICFPLLHLAPTMPCVLTSSQHTLTLCSAGPGQGRSKASWGVCWLGVQNRKHTDLAAACLVANF